MPTIEAFYLGTMADLDPNEFNYYSEGSGNLVGLTFGSNGAPLYDSIDALTLDDSDGDGGVYEDDYNEIPEDLIHDGTASGLDSTIQVGVTITYSDGTTATTAMIVLQDVSGRVFLTPHSEGVSDNDVLDDHPIVSIRIDFINGDEYIGINSDLETDAFITCFVTGTLIATKQGLMDIAQLAVGDKVCTMDRGYQPIRWIRARRVPAKGRFAPIKITAGALGPAVPTRDLWVSPQHRILLRSKIAQRMFGSAEVLLPAKKLTSMTGISVDQSADYVTYWHFLFDQHEIVYSEGAATESFYVGAQAMKSLDAGNQAEICALFPELAKQCRPPSPVRPIVQGKRYGRLLERHKKNGQSMYQDCTDRARSGSTAAALA